MKDSAFSRRQFLGTTASAAALAMIPFNHTFAIGKSNKKPNSKVNGVQLGLTTYCYRSISHNLDEGTTICTGIRS